MDERRRPVDESLVRHEAMVHQQALRRLVEQGLEVSGGQCGTIVEFRHVAGGDALRVTVGDGAIPLLERCAATLGPLRSGQSTETQVVGGQPPYTVLRLSELSGGALGAMIVEGAPADAQGQKHLAALAELAGLMLLQMRLYSAERRGRLQAEGQARAASLKGESLALGAERIQRRFEAISALNRMARAITSMMDADEILRYIMSQAQSLFNAEAASVALVDEGGQTLTFRMAVGAGAIGTIGYSLRMGEGIAGWCAQTGQPALVTDVQHDSRFYGGVDHKTGFVTRSLMCAPMIVEDQCIGVVEVINRRGGDFDEDDLHQLMAVSAQVGTAVSKARLFAEMSRRAEEMTILLETAKDIASTLDYGDVLQTIAARACRLLSADGVTVFLTDHAKGTLKPVAAMGLYAEETLAAELPLGVGVTGWVVEHGVGRIENSAHLSPLSFHLPGTALDPECLISVPLQTKGETIGAMTARRAGDRRFTDEDLHFLTSLATQASLAITNARLYAAARESAARLAALQKVARSINATLDLNAIMQTLVEQLGKLVPHQVASLAFYDDARGRLYRRGPAGASAEPLQGEEAELAQQAIEAGAPASRQTVDAAGGRCQALIAVPVMTESARLGVLLLSDERAGGFSPTEVEILVELCEHLALAIHNARLYEERERAYRELEEAQHQLIAAERLRALGQMASGIAHNFNNVLAVVMGRAQLAARRAIDVDLRHDLEAIVSAARDGAQTVRRLQDFTRLRPDEKIMGLVDLNEVVLGVAEITRPRWKDQMESEGRHVALITDTGDIPKIAGNPAELREVLTNMIFNALDAMPQGGTITLRTRREGNAVLLTVQDTGVGMTEEVKSRIFDPFFTTKGPQNSGLGLSTSYGIIVRHGGEIRVESRPGAGTTFTIVLPAAVDSLPTEEKRSEQAETQPGRILLVDDEAELCRIMQRSLESQGHQVAAFTIPSEAQAAFRQHRFDLVVTDLGMPGLSGWDLAGSIRELDHDIPIIIITGWGDHLDRSLLQEYRIDAVLGKPFSIEELLELAMQTLHKRRQAAEHRD